MVNTRQYEEQILKEIRALPEDALPKVLRLITLVRQEFLTARKPPLETYEKISHERTRQLLASSKGNWAQELIAEREDRV
jgi:hypothetical protein